MSHYGDYIKERLNMGIVEDAHGFATYKKLDEHIYIVDLYVTPLSRDQDHAWKYLDVIAQYAKAEGFNRLLGSVDPTANGSTHSIGVIIKAGFKLMSVSNNLIWLEKEL